MQKNVASQKLIVFAFDAMTNLAKTGDAANITAYVSKDYGSVTVLTDTSAAEMDSTNAKGYYLFDLAQAETNADTLLFSAKSATANIQVIAVPATVFTTPANFSLESIDSNGRLDVIKIAGTTQTARDIGASVLLSSGTGTGQVLLSSGKVSVPDTQKVDVETIKTRAVTAAGAVVVGGFVGQDTAAIGVNASGHVSRVVLVDTLTTYTNNTPQTGDSFARIGANGSALTALATAAQINGLAVNTRANLNIPVEIETPDSSTQVYKIRLHLFDVEGNMEAPDSTPTVALTNAAGTDRSSRLSSASNPSTGVYTWDYTATAGDTEEQLVWVFTVVEGGATRTYPATSYVVEKSAYRFSSADRAKLDAIHTKLPSKDYLAGTANSDGDVQMSEATGNFPGSVASVAGAVGSVTGNVGGNVAGSVGSVTTKTGYSLAADGLDSVTVETGLNARQAISIIASVAGGVLAGAATTTITIAAAGVPATNRVTATVDSSGNRSAVTLSPPA